MNALKLAAAAALTACRFRETRVATAESCTGGLIAAALTTVPGSSDVVEAGFVTYSNEAKEALLGVPAALIRAHGAVSEEVALAMAQGALARCAATIAVAVTGIAGPGGGSADKPVGLTYIAVACKKGSPSCQRNVFEGNRESLREQAAATALAMVTQAAQG